MTIKNRSWLHFFGCAFYLILCLACISVTMAKVLAGLILGGVVVHLVRDRRWKSSDPKDYGYAVFAEFGPELLIPRRRRLQETFPQTPVELLDDWLQDYEALDKLAGELGLDGGSKALGEEYVERRMRSEFPWLGKRGMSHAICRADYTAMMQ